MPGVDRETGMAFESLIFGETHLEVSYTEETDRGNGVARIQTVVVDGRSRVPDEWDGLIEALVNLVDGARLVLANPPDQIPSRG